MMPHNTFICTSCGEHIPEFKIPLHMCKIKKNLMFIPIELDGPAEHV